MADDELHGAVVEPLHDLVVHLSHLEMASQRAVVPPPYPRGEEANVVTEVLHAAGLRSVHLQLASACSIVLCIGLWTRAQSMDQVERSNAERRAICVGLWPPTLWVIGESLRDTE